MTNLLVLLFAVILSGGFLTSCTKEDLAFDVIESPVLAKFTETVNAQDGVLVMTATFYELDKSGILDKDIGIDSTLVTGLPLEIYINGSTLVEELTTDSNGQAVLEKSLEELDGANRIEWAGTYSETPFRIYRNF